jgi:hypothetical protein
LSEVHFAYFFRRPFRQRGKASSSWGSSPSGVYERRGPRWLGARALPAGRETHLGRRKDLKGASADSLSVKFDHDLKASIAIKRKGLGVNGNWHREVGAFLQSGRVSPLHLGR